VLRDAAVAVLAGAAGILLIARRRDLVGRGPFLTSQVVVYVATLCLLASGLGALSIIVRVAGD
jgi:hypothetical protein